MEPHPWGRGGALSVIKQEGGAYVVYGGNEDVKKTNTGVRLNLNPSLFFFPVKPAFLKATTSAKDLSSPARKVLYYTNP